MRGKVIGTAKSLPQAVKELLIEVNYIRRLAASVESRINSNEPVVLTIGTLAVVGTVTSISEGKARVSLKSSAVVLPGQKIAVSKKANGRWKLVAYAIAH